MYLCAGFILVRERPSIDAVIPIVYSPATGRRDILVTYKSNNIADTRRLRKASWLALVSLAWLQLTLASHQFDHVAEYFDDSCHVCVQLDRTDDAGVDHAAFITAEIVPAMRPAYSDAGMAPNTIQRRYHSRAPPRI